MNLTYLEIDHQRSAYHDVVANHGTEFRRRLVLSWLYHDHALEGEVLSQDDIDRALEDAPARNWCDGMMLHSIRALQSAIDHVYDSAQRGDELTLDWLRDLHCRLSPDESDSAGRYRQRDTSPGVYHLDVAPSSSLSYHFHSFIDSYRDELKSMHPVRQAAITHWEFMHVFPFDERTGVVGRLMLNFLLLKNDFPPAVVHATDRHHYFDGLKGSRSELVAVVADAIRSTIAAARDFRPSDSRSNARRQAVL